MEPARIPAFCEHYEDLKDPMGVCMDCIRETKAAAEQRGYERACTELREAFAAGWRKDEARYVFTDQQIALSRTFAPLRALLDPPAETPDADSLP